MVCYNPQETEIINRFAGKKYDTVLNEIPDDKKRWKCHTCYTILNNSDLVTNKCPVCGEVHIQQLCPLDHNGCQHDIVARVEVCPVCHQVLCPECGCHDVAAISRVTGYLSNFSAWNNSKQAEFKDRVRGNLGTDGQIHRIRS